MAVRSSLAKSSLRWVLGGALACVSFANSSSLVAQTSTWTGNGPNDSWFTAANWDNGVPNLLTSVAVIDSPSPTILNGSTSIQSLAIGANGILNIDFLQTLTLVGGGTSLSNSGTLTMGTRSRLNLSGILDSSGQITLNESSASDDTALFVTAGGLSLTGGGTITLNGSEARIRGNVGETLNIDHQTINGRGNIGLGELQMTISANSLIDANSAGQALTVQPGAFLAQNQGVMQASSGGFLNISGVGGGVINNSGGTIQALNGSTVQFFDGITISGGELTTVGSGQLVTLGTVNTVFEDLTISGNLVTGSRGDITLRGQIVNTGSMTINPGNATSDTLLEVELIGATLTGGGVVTLAGGSSITGVAGGTLTLANQTVQGSDSFGRGQINVVVQNGSLIDANTTGATLVLDPHSSLGVINQGTIRASNGGVLLTTGAGGGVYQNTGGTIIAASGSEVQFTDSAHIIGGTLQSQGSGVFRTLSSVNTIFEDLTFSGNLVTNSRGDLTIRGTINNQGTMTINPGNATSDTILEIEATGATLTGGGTITMNGNTSTRISGNTAGVLTLAHQTINGGGQVGSGAIGIVNQSMSLIHANVNGGIISLDVGGGGLINEGTLRASNGGLLSISDSFVNNGIMDAQAASRIDVNATLTNGLNGLMMGSGEIEVSGSMLNQGTIAPGNSAGTLFIDNGSGSNLSFDPTATLSIELASSSLFDRLTVSGNVRLGGTLELSLLGGYLPDASDVFTILTSNFSAANSFGQFANVADGGQLITLDGRGMFTVNYFETFIPGTDRVQLSNFVFIGVPEPSSALALTVLAVAGWATSRRRK